LAFNIGININLSQRMEGTHMAKTSMMHSSQTEHKKKQDNDGRECMVRQTRRSG